MEFQKVAVLGLGLIGASFAKALTKHSLCNNISGYGRTGETLVKAKEQGIIQSYSTDPRAACKEADLVVLATPVGRFESLADEIASSLKKGVLVIDVGSVKGNLVYSLEKRMPEGTYFLGCHPIAGSEKSGMETSRAELFEGARCIITPTDKTKENVVSVISAMWVTIGTEVVAMSPEQHDRIFGLVSHFPHLAAFSLVSAIADVDRNSLKYAGQGFLDSTRIALSSPSLWTDICMMNRETILKAIESYRKSLDDIGNMLSGRDAKGLEGAFRIARLLRESIEN